MSRNRKNPVAGNQNNAPMTDPTSGQVLDNTDNKGGHLDQVEKIPGSDERLEIGPLSGPVEGNSNVQKDLDKTVTVDQKDGSGASDKPSEEGDHSEGTESREGEVDGADHSSASEAGDQDEPAATTSAEGSDRADESAGKDGGTEPSDPAKAQDAQDEPASSEGSASAAAAEGSQDAPKANEEPTEESVAVSPKEAEKLSEADLRAMYSRILPSDTVAAWDYNTLYMYHLKKLVPEKTLRGNWPVDIRRTRTMVDWTSDELLDWLEGTVKAPKSVVESDLWDEIYKRFRMPGNWPREAAKRFALTGERPAYTQNGVLVDDQSRNEKQIGNWTFLELRSALLKEINSDFTDEQLVEQLRLRLGLSQNFSETRLRESLPEMPTEANVDDMLLKSKLDEYKQTMSKSGRALTETTAAQCQGFLYKAIISVMAREPRSFNEGWNILLGWIDENYNLLFTEKLARRGTSRLAMSPTAAATFEDLLTLMIHTRKPGNRAEAAKLYSLDHILRYVTSEEQRANVIAFYTPAQ